MAKLDPKLEELSAPARYWREWRGFVLFIAIMLLFRSAIADWNQVPTGSMIPSILEGDRIVVDKLAYDLRVPFTFTRLARWADPQRSDVITFESPKDGKLLVKRVIGIPGDEVQLSNNHLIINGEIAAYEIVPTEQLPAPVAKNLPHIEVARETLLGNTRTVMTQRLRHPQHGLPWGTPGGGSHLRVPWDRARSNADRAAPRRSHQGGDRTHFDREIS